MLYTGAPQLLSHRVSILNHIRKEIRSELILFNYLWEGVIKIYVSRCESMLNHIREENRSELTLFDYSWEAVIKIYAPIDTIQKTATRTRYVAFFK